MYTWFGRCTMRDVPQPGKDIVGCNLAHQLDDICLQGKQQEQKGTIDISVERPLSW